MFSCSAINTYCFAHSQSLCEVNPLGSHRKGCPCCGQQALIRVARTGFLKERIFPKFGFYPWECPQCRKKLLLRKRGFSYNRRFTSAGTENAKLTPGHLRQT